MVLSVSTDVAKLPSEFDDRFVKGLVTRLGARCEQTTTYSPETQGAQTEQTGA